MIIDSPPANQRGLWISLHRIFDPTVKSNRPMKFGSCMQTRKQRSTGLRRVVTGGRPRMHTYLQASIATSYGIAAGRPVYFFDSTANQDDLVQRLTKRLL
ncbi:hypothetical protein [Bradyrhizobium tunisiense]|uniref:hypothetical protein n=1 Tax=Bradyrhizobium tunisiense TaxID=3278709 RepID=UPI0035D70B89